MSILSDFEDRMGRALEGGFARVFRAPVQPAELARKLGKEMDRGKKLGVGKVYAPTLYNILLSRQDDQALGGFADTLSGELETYLIGYAREHNYELATRPVVRFLVDKELKLGRFEIIGELLSPEELAQELGYTPDPEPFAEPIERVPASFAGVAAAGMPLSAPPFTAEPTPRAEPVAPVAAGVFDAAGIDFDLTPGAASAAAGAIAGAAAMAAGVDVAAAPSTPAEANPTELLTPTPPLATVTVKGVDHDVVLTGDRAVVGRLATCEISLTDVNVSREHAAFEREGMGWAIRDLGSTNGTMVNGTKITRQRLRDGDMIVIGITELIYHEPRG
ncbi:MAG: DUF3662 domain-containing protein [Coriobacteriia bacterium]|nr:DUF3662 domain-containing protein [Coriobacteriia bacterium]